MFFLDDLLSWSKLALFGGVAYVGSLILYRLFFHPLRKFPGDTLASLSGFHWDLHASDSDYLPRLHKKYGPIVRIAPNELHFSEPTAYSDIYGSGSKFTKDPQYYVSFGDDESLFGTTDPRLAKTRRDIVGTLFSRRAILKLEGVVQEKVDLLISQITSQCDRPIDLYFAFRSTTLDIITSYCFARSWGMLTYPAFQHPMLNAMTQMIALRWILHAFPFLHNVLPFLLPVLAKVDPLLKAVGIFMGHIEAQIDEILRDPAALDRAEHEIVYHHLLTSQVDKGRREMPTRKALIEEARALTIAGSDTVAATSTVGVFRVLSNKQVLSTLMKELEEAWPEKDSRLSYEVLEKLPYLTAVIKETLRMSSGVVSPLPRIVGPTSARIAGVDIPAGTAVSVCSTLVHYNADVFPNPMTFDPERWLQPSSRELENYLVTFSKGPRGCLGINLAWCELYLIFGNVLRKLDMEVYDTTIKDFGFKAYFLPLYTGKHFQAKIRERTS